MTARLGFLLQGTWAPGRLAAGVSEVFRGAESIGIDTGWLAQHHVEPGRTPSPLTLLAAIGARTRRIGLGTATIMLPFENPLRLAEDAATVDQIAPGRLQLGVGSGFGLAYNAAAARIDTLFGVESSQRASQAEAVLDRLLGALRGEPIGANLELMLEPPPGALGERVWRATSSPATAAAAGKDELGLLVSSNVTPIRSRTDDSQLDLIEAYHASGVTSPRVGVLRTVRVGATASTVFREFETKVRAQVQAGGLPPDLSETEYLDRLSVHYGEGQRVADSLRAESTWPATTELIILFSGALDASTILTTLAETQRGLSC